MTYAIIISHYKTCVPLRRCAAKCRASALIRHYVFRMRPHLGGWPERWIL